MEEKGERMLHLLKNHTTKTDLVYSTLIEAIANGHIKPGSRLIIKEISTDLGVSDSPVREALRKLEVMGFVEIEPCVGAIVTKPSPKWIEEVFIIRAALEGMAVRLSIPFLAENDLAELIRLDQDMHRLEEEKDYHEYSQIDRKFHRTLYKKNSCETLKNMIEELWLKSEFGRAVFDIVPKSVAVSKLEHKRLLDAVREKDVDEAEKIIRDQKIRVGMELRQYLENENN